MTYLPDVNYWLALAFEAHAHHPLAKAWFDKASDQSVFCRLTQLGFLRLATNPKAFGDEAVTLVDAWRLYDALITDPRIVFVDEPPNLPLLWRGFTQRQAYSPKVWNDAYLAAFAISAGYGLTTFDQGFKQYNGLLNVLS